MIDLPIGLSTGIFYDRSFFDCAGPIREAGFNIIELCSSPDHLDYHRPPDIDQAARLIDALQLEPYSLHTPFGPEIDITSPDPEQRAYTLHEILLAIEAAAALGAKYFVLHPGPDTPFDPSGEQRLQRMDHAAVVLNTLHDRCRQQGIELLLENMLPHLFGGQVKEMLWIIGAIKAVDVRTCLDTGHAFIAGCLQEMTHKMSAGLKLVHVNDNQGHGDDHLAPPLGGIDWVQFLADLERVHFQGVLMLELSAAGSRMEDELEKASQARKYLRTLLR